MEVKGANGNILNDGDTVKLTKDLKLKGNFNNHQKRCYGKKHSFDR